MNATKLKCFSKLYAVILSGAFFIVVIYIIACWNDKEPERICPHDNLSPYYIVTEELHPEETCPALTKQIKTTVAKKCQDCGKAIR